MKGLVRRAIVLAIAIMMVLTMAAGAASADPMKAFGPIDVDCGSAGSYTVVAPGGQWAAALVVDSTTVIVPLAFRNQSFTYVDPDGNVTGPEVEPDAVKGSGKQAGVWCTYSFDIATGNGAKQVIGNGEVKVKFAPGS